MPMDRRRYPDDWEAIALQIKSKARWKCESCGRPCRKPGESEQKFMSRLRRYYPAWMSDLWEYWMHPDGVLRRDLKIRRFTLTTAHPNHDPENPHAELRAWCAPCHARHDAKQMQRKKRLNQELNGQLRLFP